MSAGIDDPLDPAATPVTEAGTPRRGDGNGTVEVCPFLRSQDGSWSSTHSSRELRCWAVHPAALPAISKQRQTCLVGAHADCATFVAASAPDDRFPRAAAGGDAAGLWPDTRPVPVSLDPVHGRPVVGLAPPRSGGQALLVALMVVAFLVVVLARTTSPSGTGPAGSGTMPGTSGAASMPALAASSAASASPSASALPSVSASPSAPASPSPAATAGPSVSPAPIASPAPSAQTYRVHSGDTLSSIAAKYGTTVKALAAANGIADVRTIHVGQVLVIP